MARILFVLTLGFIVILAGHSADASTCESIFGLKLPDTKITLAEVVPAGKFAVSPKLFPGPPVSPPYDLVQSTLKKLPAFCRVAAEISSVPDSDIHIEVWMPGSGWNGKFEGVGNGAWAGDIARQLYLRMAAPLREGYAIAGTDTGHVGDAADASWALGHPEKVIDFGYRAVHEMTLKAKAIIAAFYGKPANRAYWWGCSTGGKQGLMEAQRFPLDYDGILASAPANYWTHLMAGTIWLAQATHATPASYIQESKYTVIHRAALDTCDAQDGVKDGVINDPPRCHFDPGVLLCKNGEQDDCLTMPEVEAARKIYAGAKNPRTGEQVFPGLEPGSEMQWGPFIGSPEPPIIASYFKYLVFKNPNWDFRTLNFDQDVAFSDTLNAKILNATNPDLSAFIAHGGKLLLAHGWSDGLIAPQNTVNYYNSVLKTLGREKIENSVRLFMTPGEQHCGGGDGASQFDSMAVIDKWVESGKAPDRIIAAHQSGSTVDKTRPLCPFPQIAKYTGSGSTNDAVNFICMAQGPSRKPLE
jgi:feruloyl esterase